MKALVLPAALVHLAAPLLAAPQGSPGEPTVPGRLQPTPRLIAGPPPRRPSLTGLAMPSCLYQCWQLRGLPLEELRDRAGRGFITISDQREVHVELVGPRGGAGVPDELVLEHGGRTDTRWRHRLDAWVPVQNLVALARDLPEGHRMVRAYGGEPEDVVGEGPAAVGSDSYRAGGADGTGRTVAIIDSSFDNLTEAIGNGDAPAGAVQMNHTDTPFQDDGTHGTGCVEAVFDHAPGSSYRLYKVDSLSDLGSAVEDAIDNGVDVISHSMSWYNEGWWDGEGDACEAAQDAAQAGILFFTAAGNRARKHVQGFHQPGQGSADWHDWVDGDELLEIVLGPGATTHLYLDWNDDWSGTDDYDLYVFDAAGTTEIASSTSILEYAEELTVTNSSDTSTMTINVAVRRFSGNGTEFELFGHPTGWTVWEHFTSSGSTTSPSNSTHPDVLSVGAVVHDEFSSGAGTDGIIASYSSHGPTNSGAEAPHLVAPTSTTGFTYAGGFAGTSCATPNAAGAALCLWSSVPQYSAGAIRWLLLRQAQLFKDWGAGGDDPIYGRGGLSLYPFHPGTRWLTRELGNLAESTSLPNYTLEAAVSGAPAGGRVVTLPGGVYPESGFTLGKPVLIETIGANALFGG